MCIFLFPYTHSVFCWVFKALMETVFLSLDFVLAHLFPSAPLLPLTSHCPLSVSLVFPGLTGTPIATGSPPLQCLALAQCLSALLVQVVNHACIFLRHSHYTSIINKSTKTLAVQQPNLTNLSFPRCELQKVACLQLTCVDFHWY